VLAVNEYVRYLKNRAITGEHKRRTAARPEPAPV
jgi:hypothetical protein